MGQTAFSRQRDLALALGQALPVRVTALGVAMGAAHPFLVERRGAVGLVERPSAGATQRVPARLQTMAHTHPLIEHKTLAAPAALGLRHGFQVLQDAPLQVVHLLKPLLAQ